MRNLLMFYEAAHGFVSRLIAPFHCAISMIVSQNSLSFISSCVEAVEVPLSYHRVAVLRLKTDAIMYTIQNFLFIRLAMNVPVFAVILNLRTLIDTTVHQNAVELISENRRHKQEILKKCLCKYIMHKSGENIRRWQNQVIIQIMSSLFIKSRHCLAESREIN
jgi:hypothetical protein